MKIVVFASGEGSNFEALAKELSVVLLVSDNLEAKVIEKASKRNIPHVAIVKMRDETREDHERRVLEHLSQLDFDLICLAGYRRILSPYFLSHFSSGSIVNIHPSLLPLHPGLKGYEESYNDSSLEGGITIHEVDAGMDTGKILKQVRFQKIANESFDNFKKRGLELEHQEYAQTIKSLFSKQYYHRVEVLPRSSDLLQSHIVLRSRLLWVKTKGPSADLLFKAQTLLSDAVSECAFVSFSDAYVSHLYKLGFASNCLERGFLAGVTDNTAYSAQEVFSSQTKRQDISIHSGEAWRGSIDFPGFNPLLQWQKNISTPFCEIIWPEVNIQSVPPKKIDLSGNDEDLLEMNKKNWWALSLSELQLVRDYFQIQNRKPSDVEMEIIAQTWSEHCKHKIFRAKIHFKDEDSSTEHVIDSIFKTYIKSLTEEIRKERKIDWLISVFDDNAGLVRWDDRLDMAIKVETHNSPSALDPYGGALTGILGVNRDILGVGMGAKPVANTNVFCLGPSQLADYLNEAWPLKVLDPQTVREGVHRGVKDGGNKSGIPTVNGAFHYDISFAGKPLVFCGSIGVIPQKIDNLATDKKRVNVGDLVVMAGGRIGKDGIHGATFSSMEWLEGTPASVVQIGDPFTQKRLLDFILEARDLNLFSGITDNGAGGLSSSIGEMAQLTNGAKIDLSKAPVKYPGLSCWELMVSESQERMTLAVPPQSWNEFQNLASRRGVEVTALGEFTNSGDLQVFFEENEVANLSLNFLHEALPVMELSAKWNSHYQWQDWCERPILKGSLPHNPDKKTLENVILTLLSSDNIRSHETWVRQYDHEVQAASRLKPFSLHGSPSDAGIIAMGPHGGNENTGIAVGSGLAPKMSTVNPYLMGVWAVDEAVRNTVCAGGDPERMALVDNFCWPDPIESQKNPDGAYKLGMLVKTSQGMADTCRAYGLPLVSGKDSMKNDAFVLSKGSEVKISATPTLLMTCMAHRPLIQKALPSYPPKSDLSLVLLKTDSPLMALTLSDHYKFEINKGDEVNLESLSLHYRHIHQAFKDDLLMSAHDVSEGGLLVCLAEIALERGVSSPLSGRWEELFGETVGMIVVSCENSKRDELISRFPKGHAQLIGASTENSELYLSHWDMRISQSQLIKAFKGDSK
ncbi:MAG: hypothetical protein K2P81_11175 [Bacteriovoracaceae bacterium]|nr:hypothetical protein [Bacteriovoracaceae bacterium]